TDISGSALWSVRERASSMHLAVLPTYAVADAEHLPFADEMFDGVLTVASLHHAHDTLGMLLEMKRVVKPNGWVVVGVEPASWPYTVVYPLLWPLKRLIRIIRRRPINSVADDETRGFTADGLKKLFFEAGLEVIEVRPAKFLLEVYDSSCRLLEQLLRRPVKPLYAVERILDGIDRLIALIPILNRLPWHWSVIARKRA
ncbi:MAG TPA: class I SAM-dependent methyltransferase, partial [Patescibacteria group bacterium]|nr:class I SAM-dependent methyltransferase [Patescibacteria group bacterium]